MSWSGGERDCVYLNTGASRAAEARADTGEEGKNGSAEVIRFANASAVAGVDYPDDGRAAAFVDWDADGDEDLWLVQRTGPQVRFARNDAGNLAGNHFLSIRLQGDGKSAPRDAIGARLEWSLKPAAAGARPVKMIRTLRAGEGYLSQSSKWVHFGLGASTAIDRLTVRWPGGRTETLKGLKADTRYTIVQGRGRAERASDVAAAVALKPSKLSPPTPTAVARVVLATRVPLPQLPFTELGTSESPAPAAANRTVNDAVAGRPTLVNLWASWCAPCVAELRDLAAHRAELDAAGLRVIALSVDAVAQGKGDVSAGSDPAPPGGPAAARRMLERMGPFPFDAGLATEDAVGKLETLDTALFTQRHPLPVPTSFLVDRHGRVAAVYKGPVKVDQLLADVRNLDAGADDPDRLLELALPFPGRRYSRPGQFARADLAMRFIEAGYLDDATRYLTGYEADIAAGRARAGDSSHATAHYNLGVALAAKGEGDRALAEYDRAVELKPDFLDAHFNAGELLAKQGKTDKALARYRRALKVDPSYVKVLNNVGILCADAGRLDEAVRHYRKALGSTPDHLDVLNNLGNALVRMKRADEAVMHFRRALEQSPDDARTHYNLGAALDAQSRYADAAAAYGRAVRLDPKHAVAHNNLGVDLARLGKLDEAEKSIRRAMELDPAYEPAKNNLKLIQAIREKAANK
jgi:tetratricopeptide (TPR) repeat protein